MNQCLTHGQGWNFLTFPPTDGSKNKRHLLFERAFNESVVIGSGQCKAFNDMKPNKRRGQSLVRPSKMTMESRSNTTTIPWSENRFQTPPLPSPTESSSLTTLLTESSPSSFSDSSMQASTGSVLASLVNFTTEPPPSPTNYYSNLTALPEDGSPAAPALSSDTSMQWSTEMYVPNFCDTFLDLATINPALWAAELDPVEKCERPLAEVEAELSMMFRYN